MGSSSVSEGHEPVQMSATSKYLRYGIAGAACASLTHSVLVPMDVVKTRIQLQPGVFRNSAHAFTSIKNEGLRSLFVGFTPTMIGYCLQGAAKFGFYELFKDLVAQQIGMEKAQKNSLAIYLVTAGCAEVIGTTLLTPFEAIRIRALSYEASTGKTLPMLKHVQSLYAQERFNGFYKGLTPVLCKQVPYTMVQLAAFTKFVDFVYLTALPYYFPGKKKEDLSVETQLLISITCGISAGVLSAIASHPPDTILSRINMVKTPEQLAKEKIEGKPSNIQAIRGIINQLGFRGLWLGIGMRSVFVGTLSAGMFLIYDSVKVICGLPTTSGFGKKEDN